MKKSSTDADDGWLREMREMGVVGWLGYKTDRLISFLSRRRVRLWILCLYVQPVPARPMLPPAIRPQVRVGIISANEINPDEFGRPRKAIETRLNDGSVCVAARTDEGLVGYLWLQFGCLRERMFACDFRPLPGNRVCWDYDLEIAPRYRLGRTFARLWDETFQLLRQRGITHTASWIHSTNRASRSAHERMGATVAGWLVLLDIFDFKVALASSRPYVRIAGPRKRIQVPVRLSDVRYGVESRDNEGDRTGAVSSSFRG